MNKFITSTSLLSICLLTSCATIKDFRKDPSEWGKKGKKENTKKVSDKTKLPKERVVNRTRSIEANPSSTSMNAGNTNRSNPRQGRTVGDFIEPDVTQLPDNKDLEESNNVAPARKSATPKLNAPLTPLVPLLPEPADPTAPLPPTQ